MKINGLALKCICSPGPVRAVNLCAGPVGLLAPQEHRGRLFDFCVVLLLEQE